MTATARSPGRRRGAPPATRCSPGSTRGAARCSASTMTAASSSAPSWRPRPPPAGAARRLQRGRRGRGAAGGERRAAGRQRRRRAGRRAGGGALHLRPRRGEARCGFDCSAARPPQDTDGDGLSDAEELLGVEHPRFSAAPASLGRRPAPQGSLRRDRPRRLGGRKRQPARAPLRSQRPAPRRRRPRRASSPASAPCRTPTARTGVRLHLDLDHRLRTARLGPWTRSAASSARTARTGAPLRPVALSGPAGREPRRPRRGTAAPLSPGAGRLRGLGAGARRRRRLSRVRLRSLHARWSTSSVTTSGSAHHYGTARDRRRQLQAQLPEPDELRLLGRLRRRRASCSSPRERCVGAGDLDPRSLDETVPFGGPDAEVGWLATRPFYFSLHDCLRAGPRLQGRLQPRRPARRLGARPPLADAGLRRRLRGRARQRARLGEPRGPGRELGPGRRRALAPPADGSLAPALHVFAPAAVPGGSALVDEPHLRDERRLGGLAGLCPGSFAPTPQPAAATVEVGGSEQLWVVACGDGPEPIRAATPRRGGRALGLRAAARSAGRAARPRGEPGRARPRPPAAGARRVARRGDRVLLRRARPSGWGALQPLLAEALPLRSTGHPGRALGPDGRLYLVTRRSRPAARLGPAAAPSPLQRAGRPARGCCATRSSSGCASRTACPATSTSSGRGRRSPSCLTATAGPAALRADAARSGSSGIAACAPATSGPGAGSTQNGADFSLGRWHHYEAYGYTDFIAGSAPALVARKNGHLAALLSQSDLEPAKVRHVPFAEGVPDQPLLLRDFDDRERDPPGACRGLNWECPRALPGPQRALRRPGPESEPRARELRPAAAPRRGAGPVSAPRQPGQLRPGPRRAGRAGHLGRLPGRALRAGRPTAAASPRPARAGWP